MATARLQTISGHLGGSSKSNKAKLLEKHADDGESPTPVEFDGHVADSLSCRDMRSPHSPVQGSQGIVQGRHIQ